MPDNNRLALLIDSLQVLAQPADKQVQYLEGLGVAPISDELALEFDDAFHLVRQLLNDGVIDAHTYLELVELDDFLRKLSGEEYKGMWTTQAVAVEQEWCTIRAHAQRILGRIQRRTDPS